MLLAKKCLDLFIHTFLNQYVLISAVGPTGEVRMDGRIIDISAVRANVERIIAENPQQSQSVVISADKNLGLLGAANFAAQRLSNHSA